MNIDDITLGQLRELRPMLAGGPAPIDAKPCPFRVGSAYLIRTVTMAWTGRVVRVEGDFLVLTDAAWIADTGRYHQAVKAENLAEVEPIDGEAILGLGAIVDAREWASELPRAVK